MKKLLSLLLAVMLAVTMMAFATAEGNDTIVLKDDTDGENITRGGILTVAIQKGMDQGLDLTKISDCSSNFTVLGAIYEGLLTIDENGNVAPMLATEWAFAEDGLSMTLKLREDVSFSNGEKFNAEAAAKAMNYYLSDECGHVFKSSDLSQIEKVEVVDEYTIRIVLKAVDAALGLELAGSSGYIAAPSVIDNGELNTNPVGTGPFMLKEYREGEMIELVANPNYYRMGEDGQPLPYLDGIKYIIVTDDTTRIVNLQAGSVDGVDRHGSYTSVSSAMTMDGVTTYLNPVTQVYNVCTNLLYEPLKNEALRKAISMAINAEEIVEVSMEGYGAVCPFWTDAGKWFHYDYTPYTYDLEKAKEAMKEAGYENGIDLELAFIAREPDNTVAQLLQSQLSEIGINLILNGMDSASWVQYVRVDHKEQLCISLTGNAGYDPAKGWTIPLKSFGDVGTGLEIVDHLGELVNGTKTVTDEETRYAMIKEFQEIILDNYLTTILGNKYQYGSFKSSVRNIGFHYYGWWDLRDAWIAK